MTGSIEDVGILVRRLNEAEERGPLCSVLNDITMVLSTCKSVRCLLDAVVNSLPKLSKYLTATELDLQLDKLFAVRPEFSVPVLAGCLAENSTNLSVNLMSRLFVVLENGLEGILGDSLLLKPNDDFAAHPYVECVNSLVFLKDRVSNAGNRLKMDRKDTEQMNSRVEALLYAAVTKCLERSFEMLSENRDVNLRTLTMLVAKGRNVAIKNSTLLDLTVSWLCAQPATPLWDRVSQRLFTDDTCGIREFESLLIAVVIAVANGEQLRRCLGYSIKHSSCVRRVCTRRLLLQRVCPDRVPTTLAEYILQAGGKEFFNDTLKTLLQVWSDVSTIKFTPLEQQKYLTQCVLEFGKQIKNLDRDAAWSPLFPLVITGVQERLDNSDLCIRQSGMFVGEKYSSWLQEGENELRFEYTEDEWLTKMRSIVDGAPPLVPVENVIAPEISDVPCVSNLSIGNQYASNALDSDDEEDFPAFEVPENERNVQKLKEGEEAESKHPAPNYIRDCLEMLDEKKKYEVFESGFFSLESFIRRRAIGFDDVASELATKLVFLVDKFSTKDFESIRKRCLVGCLVAHPELAPSLCEEMYSRNSSFFHRYLILECLLLSARELSSPPTPLEKPAVSELPKQNEVIDNSNWRSVVDERIRSKTRHFAKERATTERRSANRFAAVATLFFYPLLRTDIGEHLQLKSKDAPFLSRIVFTAGDILQLACRSLSIVKMSSGLSSFVSYLRFHDVPAIRGAVLYSYFSIANALSDELFVEVMSSEVRTWLDWMCSVADNSDYSEQDRTMARNVTSVIVQKIRSRESTRD